MHRTLALLFAALLLPALVLACSGNAVVEPGYLTTKRAKAFLEKCNAPPPEGGTSGELKEVYACLSAEDGCPEASDELTAVELGYQLEKANDCGETTVLYDVPCGPDLNAVECCYVVRLSKAEPACD